MPNPTTNILVICGPTASGKTSLALSVASCLRSEIRDLKSPSVNILSADSRQVFKGLDIVTGKDIPADLPPNISLLGLDLVEQNQAYNLADFVSYSQKIIQSSIKENVPLIIVGGTGLYLKAITSDLLSVHVPPNQSLRFDLEKLDLPSLQSRLFALNHQKFESLNNSDKNNPRRLIRAIEIASSVTTPVITTNPPVITTCPSGRRGEAWQSIKMTQPHFQWIGLKPDRETLKLSIRRRVLDRLDSGAIKEVENLIVKYPDLHLPIYTSLGVKQILQFLHQEISREELIERWTLSEIDYGRRQMVWFKKQSGIVWYDKSTVDSHLITKLAEIYK